jgi:Cu2+-containing amine oxidase
MNRVQKYDAAALHDHSVGIKLDIDLTQEKNAFRKTSFSADAPEKILGKGRGNPDYMLYWPIRNAKREIIKTEKEALLSQNPSSPSYWEFIDSTTPCAERLKDGKIKGLNEGGCTSWGHPRGYRLTLMTDQKQVLPDEHPLMGGCPGASFPDFSGQTANCTGSRGAGDFTRQNLLVAQRKEDEPFITGRWDANRLADPQVSTKDFYADDESIEDEDLVAWVSFAMTHLPIAEDVPMTNMVHMGLDLKPANFHDSNEAFKQPVDVWVSKPNEYSKQHSEHSPTTTTAPCQSRQKIDPVADDYWTVKQQTLGNPNSS